jgi:hypothetical protein
LVVCAKCHVRMLLSYGGSTNQPLYCCTLHAANYGTPSCQRVAGSGLDQLVSRRVLAALEPAALALSVEAAPHVEQERTTVTRAWHQRRARARYAAARAARR